MLSARMESGWVILLLRSAALVSCNTRLANQQSALPPLILKWPLTRLPIYCIDPACDVAIPVSLCLRPALSAPG